jgi:hypothetical protein
MCYAAWTKGTSALLLAIRAAASFFTVVVWRDQAEHAAQSLSKGSRVAVYHRVTGAGRRHTRAPRPKEARWPAGISASRHARRYAALAA